MIPLKSIPQDRMGFTLLEVVLALTIFALMGTVLYGAFSLGHSAVERSKHHFEKNQKLRSFGDLLGNYIRSSYPYRASRQDPTPFYEGEADHLTFVSAVSLAMGGRGMAKIRLSWEAFEQGGGPLMLEEVVPVRIGEEASDGGLRNRLVVRDRVHDFRLAYLDPTGGEEKWEDRWDGKEKRMLPRAVRLSYRDAAGQETHWVFPLMIVVLAP